MKERLKLDKFFVETERFYLRCLKISDVSNRYLGWMNDKETMRYIVSGSLTHTLDSLNKYVEAKSLKADCLFLGIFEKNSNLHIGNIKYEPIDMENKKAIMGVLVGEKSWRGKEVFSEILIASSNWLNVNLGITDIILGVDLTNINAIKAYEKTGFVMNYNNELSWCTIKNSMSFTIPR